MADREDAATAAIEAHTAFRATRRFTGLDGIRCIAVVAVVWHHSYAGQAVALKRGFLGVDLFFVLSGFLISTLLLRERDATGSIALGRFWLRRGLRLLPPLYLMIAVLACYHGIHAATPRSEAFFRSLPENIFFYSNWSSRPNAMPVLWSLATEEQFYLAWPLVERFFGALAWPVLALAMAANQAMNFGLLDPLLAGLPKPAREYEIVAATYMPICLGILLGRLMHRRGGFALSRRLLGGAAAPWIVLAALAMLISWAPAEMRGWPRLTVQLLMAMLVCAVVLRPRGAPASWLEWPPIVRVGTISYGIYLYHIWFAHPARQLAGPLFGTAYPVLFGTTLLLAIIAAEISYRFVETPALRLARRFHASS